MVCVHEIISSRVQSLSLSQKTRSSSAHQDDQSTNCIDFCLSHTSKTRFMYASQDSSLVRHFWRYCRAGTCTAQRSPGCRTVCVCDKHTVNKAGKHARSGTTTDPASPPSSRTFLLNSAVRHASWKGESCRFANCEERPAERKTTARIENETLGWAGLQRSAPWDFAGLLVQIISTQSMVYGPRLW